MGPESLFFFSLSIRLKLHVCARAQAFCGLIAVDFLFPCFSVRYHHKIVKNRPLLFTGLMSYLGLIFYSCSENSDVHSNILFIHLLLLM